MDTVKEYIDRQDRPLREGCEDTPDEPMKVVVDPGVPSKGQVL